MTCQPHIRGIKSNLKMILTPHGTSDMKTGYGQTFCPCQNGGSCIQFDKDADVKCNCPGNFHHELTIKMFVKRNRKLRFQNLTSCHLNLDRLTMTILKRFFVGILMIFRFLERLVFLVILPNIFICIYIFEN